MSFIFAVGTVVFLVLALIVGTFVVVSEFYSKKSAFIVTLILLIAFTVLFLVYTNSASFNRQVRNVESEFSGGIEREIIIYNAEGKEIFQLEGKFDFTYDDQCIEYIDTATGLKHNIFAGNNTSVIINEVKEWVTT